MKNALELLISLLNGTKDRALGPGAPSVTKVLASLVCISVTSDPTLPLEVRAARNLRDHNVELHHSISIL